MKNDDGKSIDRLIDIVKYVIGMSSIIIGSLIISPDTGSSSVSPKLIGDVSVLISVSILTVSNTFGILAILYMIGLSNGPFTTEEVINSSKVKFTFAMQLVTFSLGVLVIGIWAINSAL